MSVFSQFVNDKIRIIKKDDSDASKEIKANIEGNKICVHIQDLPNGLSIDQGDFIERILSNNKTERYLVLDPGYKTAFHTIPEYYEAKVKKQ